ncbi:MAG: trimethyllysine dioxygenase [Mesorhizobium sp.]|uniref:TauD/TfdA family dioxygenase n=1 Tax=Mesorhizobium sp. TaxID=1871066 RepID=UPI00121F800A|nr:TauD/TfdA family dioxygenase [Mesorhizobium sp.]TIM96865.1 MAG: trimethyllysine dioxygenase [Mesorhizobium sp.]
MDKRITHAAADKTGLTVTVDGNEKFFSWLWVRDHSQEPGAFHQEARQRLLETFNLGLVPPADTVSVDEIGEELVASWRGTPVSRFTADYLAAVTVPDRLYDVIGSDQTVWDANNATECCQTVKHDDFANDDDVLAMMLQNLRRYGMILVKDVPLSTEASRRVVERIAYIRSSIFGEMWDLKSNAKMADTGATPLEITPHSDGTYNHDAPGLMSLHCLKYEAEGGDNSLVDGFNIAQIIRREYPQAYKILSTVLVPGQYIGDGAYLVAQRTPLRHDVLGQLVQVSFNNHDRAPFSLPEPEMSQLYDALRVFDGLIKNISNQFVFGLRPGDMVIFDNWRLLHGRKEYKGSRHVVGCYLNREDFESRMRMLAKCPMNMVS